MNLRPALTALGVAITAFLLVAAALVELLAFSFSALVALPVALLASVVAFVVAFTEFRFRGPSLRRVATAAAGFGYAVLALLVVRSANLAGLRRALTTGLLVAVAVLAATAVYAGLWFHEEYEAG